MLFVPAFNILISSFRDIKNINIVVSNLTQEMKSPLVLMAVTANHINSEIVSLFKVDR